MANKELIADQNLFIKQSSKLQGAFPQVTNLLEGEQKKNTITVLDGMRGLACFLVMFYHLNLVARDYHIWIPIHDFGSLVGSIALCGQSGVILFFILSGFLLFLPYAKSMLLAKDWPSVRLFYLRRAFRIMPAYYISLFLLTIALHSEYLQKTHWEDLWLFMTFRMDFPQTFQKINGPFWTMAIEVQFYVVLPLLAWAMSSIVCRGSLRRRVIWLSMCVAGIIAWGLLSRYWGLHWRDWTYPAKNSFSIFVISPAFVAVIKPYIFGTDGKYFEDFGIGMLLCVAYVYSQNTPADTRWNTGMRRLSPLFFSTGLIMLFFIALWHFYTWYYDHALHVMDPYRDLLINGWGEWQAMWGGISYGLFMCALLYGPKWLTRPWEWAPLRWIGLSSYSLYIWHLPLMTFFVQHLLPNLQANGIHRLPQYGLFCLWVLCVIVPFSLCSYLLIERPGMHLGEIVQQKLLKSGGLRGALLKFSKNQRRASIDIPVLDRSLENAMSSQRD